MSKKPAPTAPGKERARRQYCEICGCWVVVGSAELASAWATHKAGIRHRRNVLSTQHFGRADLRVVSIFEPESWVAATASSSRPAFGPSAHFADVVPHAALRRVVAEVCGACTLYTQILRGFKDESSLQAARARLDLATSSGLQPTAVDGAAIPQGVHGIPDDVRAAFASLHGGDTLSSSSSEDESSSDDDDEDEDAEEAIPAPPPAEPDNPADAIGTDTSTPARVLDLMSVKGGLAPCELMLLAAHLPQHAHTHVWLPVRYSTGLRGATAGAVGMLLLLQALRTCPALRHLRIQFKLDAQELSQEILQDVVPGPVALAFRRVFQEIEHLLLRCPALRSLSVSTLGRRMLADGNAADLMLRLQAASRQGRDQTRMAVLMGTHQRLGRRSPLHDLPVDVLDMLLSIAAPKVACRLQMPDLVIGV